MCRARLYHIGALPLPDVRSKFLFELFLRQEAGGAFGGLAVLEQDERGNAHDLVLHGDIGIVVDVHLDDLHFRLPFGGELFDDGIEHFARAAPDGAEIDENGLIGLNDFCLEIF